MTTLQTDYHFPVCIHRNLNTSFVNTLLPIHDDHIRKIREQRPVDTLYPATMTDFYSYQEPFSDFFDFLQHNAEQAILAQGYLIKNFDVIITDVFSQQHEYTSSMESHFHPGFLTGFYFLEVPEPSPVALFFDPKDVKVHNGFIESDHNIMTPAVSVVNYRPEPGLMIMTNSWLKHAFTRNPSQQPLKFIHFSVNVHYNPEKTPPAGPPIVV